jgi:hypothetical protein
MTRAAALPPKRWPAPNDPGKGKLDRSSRWRRRAEPARPEDVRTRIGAIGPGAMVACCAGGPGWRALKEGGASRGAAPDGGHRVKKMVLPGFSMRTARRPSGRYSALPAPEESDGSASSGLRPATRQKKA